MGGLGTIAVLVSLVFDACRSELTIFFRFRPKILDGGASETANGCCYHLRHQYEWLAEDAVWIVVVRYLLRSQVCCVQDDILLEAACALLESFCGRHFCVDAPAFCIIRDS